MASAIVTDVAISRIIEQLDADITHIGLGDGSTDLTDASTLLDNEVSRKESSNTIDDNTLVIEGFWDYNEGNDPYTEGGCFCDGATSTVDTGSLFAGANISVDKDNTQSLTLSIEITVEAVNPA